MPNYLSVLGFFAFVALVLVATFLLLRLRQNPGDFIPLTPTKPLLTAYQTPFQGLIPDETGYFLTFGSPGTHIRGNPTTAPPTKIFQQTPTINDALYAPAPVCYTSANRTLICLGRVFNNSDKTVRDVQINVGLWQDEQPLAANTVRSEQPVMRPGEFAPYRALFRDVPTSYDDVRASVQDATTTTADYPQLSVRDESAVYWQGAAEIGRYEIQATLVNEEDAPVQDVRVTITVLNGDEDIVGYRVLALSTPIPANGIYPFKMDIIPLTIDRDLHYTLTVTAN